MRKFSSFHGCRGWRIPVVVILGAVLGGCGERSGGSERNRGGPPKHLALVKSAMKEDKEARNRAGSRWSETIALGNGAVPALKWVIVEDEDELRATGALLKIGTPEAFNAFIGGVRSIPRSECDYCMWIVSRWLESTPRWTRASLDDANAEWLDKYIRSCDEERALPLIAGLGPEHYRRRLDRLTRSKNAEVRLMADQILRGLSDETTSAANNDAARPEVELLRLQHDGLLSTSPRSVAHLMSDESGAAVIVLVERGTPQSTVHVFDALNGVQRAKWAVPGRIGHVSVPVSSVLVANTIGGDEGANRVCAWDALGRLLWSSAEFSGSAPSVAAMVNDGQVQEALLDVEDGVLLVADRDGALRKAGRMPLALHAIADPQYERYLIRTHTELQWWRVAKRGGVRLPLSDLPLRRPEFALLREPATRVVLGGGTERGAGGVIAYDANFRELWTHSLDHRVEALATLDGAAGLPSVCALNVNGSLVGLDADGQVMVEIDTGWINPLGRWARGLSCLAIDDVLHLLIHHGRDKESRVYAVRRHEG